MMFRVLFSFQILDVWIWLHVYSFDIQEFSFMTIFHLSLTFQITPDIAYERWSTKWSIIIWLKVLSLNSLYYSSHAIFDMETPTWFQVLTSNFLGLGTADTVPISSPPLQAKWFKTTFFSGCLLKQANVVSCQISNIMNRQWNKDIFSSEKKKKIKILFIFKKWPFFKNLY